MHAGQDLPAPMDTPIPAAAKGTVYNIEDIAGYGHCVVRRVGNLLPTRWDSKFATAWAQKRAHPTELYPFMLRSFVRLS